MAAGRQGWATRTSNSPDVVRVGARGVDHLEHGAMREAAHVGKEEAHARLLGHGSIMPRDVRDEQPLRLRVAHALLPLREPLDFVLAARFLLLLQLLDVLRHHRRHLHVVHRIRSAERLEPLLAQLLLLLRGRHLRAPALADAVWARAQR